MKIVVAGGGIVKGLPATGVVRFNLYPATLRGDFHTCSCRMYLVVLRGGGLEIEVTDGSKIARTLELPSSLTSRAPPTDFVCTNDSVSVLPQMSVNPAASESSVGGIVRRLAHRFALEGANRALLHVCLVVGVRLLAARGDRRCRGDERDEESEMRLHGVGDASR